MARTVNADEYNARRNEILDAALALVYSKGYERMTIQDILDGLHISKGALYHYFGSKEALLEALVDRMGREAGSALSLIVEDESLPAIEKFRRFFQAAAQLKTMRKSFIVGFLRAWYADENAPFRSKVASEALRHTSPLIEPIIRQGIAEGVFTTRFPEQAARIVAGLDLSLADTIVGLLLSSQADQATREKLQVTLDAYVDAVERVIGAPAGSLNVFEPGAFDEWQTAMQPEPAAA